MDKVIEVKNLRKTYRISKGKELEAVKGISFDVYKGEVFGILGPNGAGKTTTLEIIECIRPQTSGSVAVLGFNNLKAADEIKKQIGVQLQSSQYLHHLSLRELLDLFASFYQDKSPLPSPPPSGEGTNPQTPTVSSSPLRGEDRRGWKKDDRQKLLNLVGLEDKVDEEFSELSGGQKQRFTIATSLVHKPQILFLDEPTTGLDPKARRDMWQLIKKINADGITIVITTHYMEEAEFLCHRVAIMDQGQILEIDEPKKLIDRMSDTIQISFFTDNKIDAGIFKAIPEIKKVHDYSPKVILEISSLDKISTVVGLLKQHSIIFYGFTVKTATLEDVYLQLTGKEYENE